MPPPNPSSTSIDRVLDQLACPVCHGPLRLEPEKLVCTNCRRDYPVVDGIPILIADKPEA